MNQIFISYRRLGGDAVAYLLHEKLTSLGFDVFYDIESLHCGRFDSNIFRSIDECSDVLVVLSPNALDRCVNKDDWLRTELSYAIKHEKNVIPLIMDGFEWPQDLPEDIENLKNYNGVPVSFKFFDSCLERIISFFSLKPAKGESLNTNSKKEILLWADFNNAVLDKVIKRLQLSDDYQFEELNDPLNILSRNLNAVEAIILIVTDCTKFSNNDLAINRINQTLINYVRQGGRLICTHDAIYRRTRNELLQEMYGCRITHFKEAKEVIYIKSTDCKENGLFPSLPESFTLHDAELCWGDLAYDVDVHFETPDGVPLVFSREYGDGVCIYLHSGDYKFSPPPSIGKPEKEFVNLLHDAICFDF